MGFSRGSPLHYCQIGARVPPVLQCLVYIMPVAIYLIFNRHSSSPSSSSSSSSSRSGEEADDGLVSFLHLNAIIQLVWFLLVVQIPALVTHRMTYVDIGWPGGLTIIAINALRLGTGLSLRRYLTAIPLLFHGGRMAVGAIAMFGTKTKWTFMFKEDLPRYRFAAYRWSEIEGMRADTWWIKMQHDCFQQGWYNMSFLALPVAMAAFNDDPSLHFLELVGVVLWVAGYAFENMADGQKQLFLRDARAAKKKADQESLKTKKNMISSSSTRPVLGLAPWDSARYSLWTVSRHPNYFGELCCWCGFTCIGISQVPSTVHRITGTALPSFSTVSSLSSLSSLIALLASPSVTAAMALMISLLIVPVFFYDCLVFWTGAAPAEFFSLQRRERYRDYQQKVPCLLPRPLSDFLGGRFGDYRIPGWPGVGNSTAVKGDKTAKKQR